MDCAQGGQTMMRWARPDHVSWEVAAERLKRAGVTPEQVQVVWMKLANGSPTGTFQDHARRLKDDTVNVPRNLRDRFPNLQIVYLGSRIYGGYATEPLNPEPYAYEGAFVVRWLSQDQINHNPRLNYDAERGPVKSPLLFWGRIFRQTARRRAKATDLSGRARTLPTTAFTQRPADDSSCEHAVEFSENRSKCENVVCQTKCSEGNCAAVISVSLFCNLTGTALSRHHDIIPQLVEACASIHSGCGVVLIGSVARGTQHSDSDIDLNLVFPDDDRPLGQHPYVADDNRWQLVLKGVVCGIRVDVAWETERALLKRLQSDDIVNSWPFSNGRVLRDPRNCPAVFGDRDGVVRPTSGCCRQIRIGLR